MALRIAVLGDIHGNIAALDAALVEVKKAKPDLVAVTGDLVMNGPRPAEVVARVRELEAKGAVVVQGNTDVAVADFDFAAAFPWLDEIPDGHRAAAEWAHDALTADDLGWLRRLAAERRIREADEGDPLVLVCHGSPGSQTGGLAVDLDISVTTERLARTDAIVVACGHTHVADLREVGRKLICNPGSCGYAFDGDPGAAWALLTIDDEGPRAELRRTEYDTQPVSDELSQRGLPGDIYRAATVRRGRFVG
ncbi:MAG TPA: metallophosphoesterase family protein [Candidatus Limnocylindrales bacterium]|nr:metallophosphoesterase family protein [Candidatus Limnocylindrales bacterium]